MRGFSFQSQWICLSLLVWHCPERTTEHLHDPSNEMHYRNGFLMLVGSNRRKNAESGLCLQTKGFTIFRTNELATPTSKLNMHHSGRLSNAYDEWRWQPLCLKTKIILTREIKKYYVKSISHHTNLHLVLELRFALKAEKQLMEKAAS